MGITQACGKLFGKSFTKKLEEESSTKETKGYGKPEDRVQASAPAPFFEYDGHLRNKSQRWQKD